MSHSKDLEQIATLYLRKKHGPQFPLRLLGEVKNSYWERNGKNFDISSFESLFDIGITIIDEKGNPEHFRSLGKSFNIGIQRNKKGGYKLIREGGMMKFHSILNCPECGQVFTSVKSYQNHKSKKSCDPERTRVKYSGGSFMNSLKTDLWVGLSAEGFSIPNHLRVPAYFAVFDFETKFHSHSSSEGKKTQLTKELTPVSFALHSNVPGTDIKFEVDPSPRVLFRKLWDSLNELSDRAYRLLRPRYEYIFKELKSRESLYYEYLKNKPESKSKETWNRARHRQLVYLLNRLESFVRQIPIIGFNSQRFDLNLIQRDIARELTDNKKCFIIKRGSSYMCISTQKFRFIDILNYLSPGYSLLSFLKAYLPDIDTEKLKFPFPYAWLTDFEKLHTREFPSRADFYDTVTMSELSERDYAVALRYWNQIPDSKRTMLEYLKVYNCNDCVHFLEACKKISSFWSERVNMDPFRSALSLPSMSAHLLYLHKCRFSNVLTATKRFKNFQAIIDDGIVGGPSIIFLRYSKANETKIKETVFKDEAKYVKSVVTWDINSLYLHVLSSKRMPCENWYGYRREGDLLVREKMHRYYNEEVEWLSYTEFEESKTEFCRNHRILHSRNGGPVRLGHIPVDGFCCACRTVYMYNGCASHGGCLACGYQNLLSKTQEECDEILKKREDTERSRRYISSFGHRVVEITSCAWKARFRSDISIRKFCSKYFPNSFQSQYCQKELLSAVRNDKFFGLLRVKMHVPDSACKRYWFMEDFPPFFVNKAVPMSKLSKRMQDIGIDCHDFKPNSEFPGLISTLEVDEFVVISPLLKFYLDFGIEVDYVYEALAFTGKTIFSGLGSEIHKYRVAAQQDPSQELHALSLKLAGNAAYGKCIENRRKQRDYSFVSPQGCKDALSDPKREVINIVPLDESTYELTESKKFIYMDSPRVLGAFILGYAKLELLNFAYTLGLFVSPMDFSYISIDTDSLCAELSAENGDIDSLILPEKQEEWWRSVRHQFFPRDTSLEEQKKQGLLKVEFLGTEAVALNAKVYALLNELTNTSKQAHKGVSKRTNHLDFETYKSTLFNTKIHQVKNTGFKKAPEGRMFQYELTKTGLSPFYSKRMTDDAGINTFPIRFKD